MTEQRRLAAILVADVVGYSKLMGSDEAGTLAQLEALRTEIIEPQIAKHAGRLFKSVGDGFLIEFASAVQAVSCAKAIQEANGLGRLPLRIGIHVGDVVVQGDDLMGDGVNVAARVEGIAEPGGIAITRAVHEQVRDKLDLGFMDKGEIELKNIQRPVQVFVIGGAKVDGQATALPLPDKPSIAVLPFQNMSGDPEQEYFADGMVEDIITALSRFKSLFVIARNSSFTYKGKAVDIRQVGRELGVRYVLEGSVRKAANRLRISGQLIDAATGGHLWADQFRRRPRRRLRASRPGDVERGRRDCTETRAGRDRARHAQADRKPGCLRLLPARDGSLSSLHEGQPDWKPGGSSAARRSSIPTMLPPMGSARGASSVCQTNGWLADTGARNRRGREAGAPRGGDRHGRSGRAGHRVAQAWPFWLVSLESGIAYVDRAIVLNPNLALAWSVSGWLRMYLGEHDGGHCTLGARHTAEPTRFARPHASTLAWAGRTSLPVVTTRPHLGQERQRSKSPIGRRRRVSRPSPVLCRAGSWKRRRRWLECARSIPICG